MERWKPIVGYEGLYDISDHGNVRKTDGTLLRQGSHHGYKSVRLYGGPGDMVKYRVHRLVALHFLRPAMQHQTYVMHLDDTRDNNHYTNLRWGTPKENTQDSLSKGRHHNKQHRRKLNFTPDQLREISDLRISGMSKRDIRARFGEVDGPAMNRVFAELGF